MRTLAFVLGSLMASAPAALAWAQGPKYPPLSEYTMLPQAEVALARSAAPDNISGRASIKILTAAGYKLACPRRQRVRMRGHVRVVSADLYTCAVPQLCL